MRKLSILIPVLAIMAAACGGSSGSGSPLANQALEKAAEQAGANVDVNSDGGLTVETDEGSITFGGTDSDGGTVDYSATDADGDVVSGNSFTSVPPDFPLPVPDQIDNIYASTTKAGQDTTWLLTFDFDPSRVDEISKMYESAATDQGFTIDGSYTDADNYTLLASKGELNILVGMTNFGEYWEASVEWTSYG